MFSISYWNDLNQWTLEHVLDWVVWVEYNLSQSPQRQCTLRNIELISSSSVFFLRVLGENFLSQSTQRKYTLRNTELISSSFVFFLRDLCVKISYHKVHRENTHGEIQSKSPLPPCHSSVIFV